MALAPSTAIRWHAQRRDVGHFKPKVRGGDMRSHLVEKRATDILALCEANRDITLKELRTELSTIGLAVSIAGLHRFFKRHGMTRKKDRPRHRTGSSGYPEGTPGLVWRPTRSRSGAACLYRCRAKRGWTTTNMARTHGRCRKGERLRMGLPTWASQDHDAACRTAPVRHGGAHGA